MLLKETNNNKKNQFEGFLKKKQREQNFSSIIIRVDIIYASTFKGRLTKTTITITFDFWLIL